MELLKNLIIIIIYIGACFVHEIKVMQNGESRRRQHIQKKRWKILRIPTQRSCGGYFISIRTIFISKSKNKIQTGRKKDHNRVKID